MKSIVYRPRLADCVPSLVFTAFFVVALWTTRYELWWLALALVVVGVVAALVTWRKLGSHPDRWE